MDRGSGGPATAQVLDDRTGTVLCGWTLERSLGGGAVCESWLGEREGSKSAVVRILREPFASHAETRAEWVGASWAPNRLSHARIPRVMQDGADDHGLPVVVRGWARGTPLDHVVRNGGMDSKLVLRLAEQLLDALETSHANGIIHGALAPSNVIVTPRGSLRLVDFATTPGPAAGIAPTAPAALAALAARPVDELLQARARTSPFVAPEQRASEQSDVWSVGACLHFAIAGVAPSGDPWQRAALDCDPALAKMIDRALAADPRDRYASAHAMLGDIRGVIAGSRTSLSPSSAAPPSQGAAELQGPRSRGASAPPAPGVDHDLGTDAEAAAPRRSSTSSIEPSEWRGTTLLFVAIAIVVILAAWVMARF
jgi:serine/threonine protein kinase